MRPGEKLKVDASRAYYGPDAYKELANSKLDAVVIETPTLLPPRAGAAAVDAGKHVYWPSPSPWTSPAASTSSKPARKPSEEAQLLGRLPEPRHAGLPGSGRAHPPRRHRQAGSGPGLLLRRPPAKDKGTPGMDPGQRRVVNFYMDRCSAATSSSSRTSTSSTWPTGTSGPSAEGQRNRRTHRLDRHALRRRRRLGPLRRQLLVPQRRPRQLQLPPADRHFSDLCVRCFGIKGAADTHYGGLVRITGERKPGWAPEGTTPSAAAPSTTSRTSSPASATASPQQRRRRGREQPHRHPRPHGRLQQRTVTWDEMLASTEKWEVGSSSSGKGPRSPAYAFVRRLPPDPFMPILSSQIGLKRAILSLRLIVPPNSADCIFCLG